MSLANPFNHLLSLHRRAAKIKIIGKNNPSSVTAKDIFISPSNYFRNGATVEDTVVAGHEFVISMEVLQNIGESKVTRGDILIDTQLGTLRIEESKPMYDFGGSIIGFRVRTG